jgi:hypothetical protein
VSGCMGLMNAGFGVRLRPLDFLRALFRRPAAFFRPPAFRRAPFFAPFLAPFLFAGIDSLPRG